MTHRAIEPSQPSTLISLARDVLFQTEEITKYLEGNGFSALSFDPSSLGPPETKEYEKLYRNLKASLEDLTLLVDGPKRFWRQLCGFIRDLGAFQVAVDSEFFTLVPAGASISMQNLAEKAGVPIDRTGRIVPQLITYGVFAGNEAGSISHTPASLAMLDEEFRCLINYSFVSTPCPLIYDMIPFF